MIGKILSHLLGNTGEEEAANEAQDKMTEFEEEGWVIVDLPGESQSNLLSLSFYFFLFNTGVQTYLFVLKTEDGPLMAPDVDPLENLLIEHPSMSVYQMRCALAEAEGEELDSDEDETSRLF